MMIVENNSHDTDPAGYTKEKTHKRQNSINMTNRNRKSNIRPSICTTENYLQNHMHHMICTTLIQMQPDIREEKQ